MPLLSTKKYNWRLQNDYFRFSDWCFNDSGCFRYAAMNNWIVCIVMILINIVVIVKFPKFIDLKLALGFLYGTIQLILMDILFMVMK